MNSLYIIGFLACISFAGLPASGFCQDITSNYSDVDTINTNDSKGKKSGYWIELLDKCLRKTRNERKAVAFRFAYFEKGVRVYPVVDLTSKRKYRIENMSGDTLLHGEILFYFKKSDYLVERDSYTRGRLQWVETYYENGNLSFRIEYLSATRAILSTYTIDGELESSEQVSTIKGRWKWNSD